MVVGAVAYEVLKADSPAALAGAVALLKSHPDYPRLWQRQMDRLPEPDRDLYLFMMAGRWADDIRGTDADRPTWHYINFPVKPAGQPESVKAPAPAEPNILTALADNRTKLTAAPEVTERAVALTWLVHLLSDIHQPLHTVALFTTDYPDGDRGGNRVFIRAGPDARAINLHRFWDDLLLGRDDFRAAKNTAIELRLRPEFAREKLTELTAEAFEAWAKDEGVRLAAETVYHHGAIAGGTSELTAKTLPDGYTKAAKAAAERRAVLAGYRTAAVLKAAMGN
jgi:hypothetical protein